MIVNRAEQIADAKSVRASSVGIHEGARAETGEKVRRVLRLDLYDRILMNARFLAGFFLKLPPDTVIVDILKSAETFGPTMWLESRAFPVITPGERVPAFEWEIVREEE